MPRCMYLCMIERWAADGGSPPGTGQLPAPRRGLLVCKRTSVWYVVETWNWCRWSSEQLVKSSMSARNCSPTGAGTVPPFCSLQTTSPTSPEVCIYRLSLRHGSHSWFQYTLSVRVAWYRPSIIRDSRLTPAMAHQRTRRKPGRPRIRWLRGVLKDIQLTDCGTLGIVLFKLEWDGRYRTVLDVKCNRQNRIPWNENVSTKVCFWSVLKTNSV